MRGAFMWRLVSVISVCFALIGCASGLSVPGVGADQVGRGIGENASRLNEQHMRATNGIILSNILRAKDRWPTSYTTVSGISSSPKSALSGGATFSPLGLGNPRQPFMGSTANIAQNNEMTAEYAVNPISNEGKAIGVISSVPRDAFRYYWDHGWPKDVLLHLFVEETNLKYWEGIRGVSDEYLQRCEERFGENKFDSFACKIRTAPGISISYPILDGGDKESFKSGCTTVFSYDLDPGAKNLKSEPSASNQAGGSAEKPSADYVDKLLDTFEEVADNGPFSLHFGDHTIDVFECRDADWSVRIVQDYSDKDTNETSEQTLATIVRLRSFDGIIYSLGENLRGGGANFICAPDHEDCDVIVPLFQVVPDARVSLQAERLNFAASALHAGQRYFAGETCQDRDEQGNLKCNMSRTGTVLSILSQVFILLQSSELLEAPDAAIIRSQ